MKAKDLATQKANIVRLTSDMSIEEALKIILKSNLSSVPVIEKDSNRYLYSLSSTALLKKIVAAKDDLSVYKEPISTVTLERFIVPCSLETNIESLIDLVVNQNFVPLVDSAGVFQGIVTRKAVINYMSDLIGSTEE